MNEKAAKRSNKLTESPSKPTYISPSQLKNIFMCEGLYQSKYILNDPSTPFGANMISGTIIDSIFTDFFSKRINGEKVEFMDLDQIEAIYMKERDRALETGADWVFEKAWLFNKRQDLWLRMRELGQKYVTWFDEQGYEALFAQKKVEGVIDGENYYGIVDLIYRRPDGTGVIVDWKLQTRRNQLRIDHHLQVSIYAWMTGTWDMELHYLVPYGKEIGWKIHHSLKPLSKEFITSLAKKRERIHQGDVILNPSNNWCNPKMCAAWHHCPVGEARNGFTMPEVRVPPII